MIYLLIAQCQNFQKLSPIVSESLKLDSSYFVIWKSLFSQKE